MTSWTRWGQWSQQSNLGIRLSASRGILAHCVNQDTHKLFYSLVRRLLTKVWAGWKEPLKWRHLETSNPEALMFLSMKGQERPVFLIPGKAGTQEEPGDTRPTAWALVWRQEGAGQKRPTFLSSILWTPAGAYSWPKYLLSSRCFGGLCATPLGPLLNSDTATVKFLISHLQCIHFMPRVLSEGGEPSQTVQKCSQRLRGIQNSSWTSASKWIVPRAHLGPFLEVPGQSLVLTSHPYIDFLSFPVSSLLSPETSSATDWILWRQILKRNLGCKIFIRQSISVKEEEASLGRGINLDMMWNQKSLGKLNQEFEANPGCLLRDWMATPTSFGLWVWVTWGCSLPGKGRHDLGQHRSSCSAAGAIHPSLKWGSEWSSSCMSQPSRN